MFRCLSTAATGMVAQQRNLDVIANNLANVNTTGFKSMHAEFQDLVYQTYKSSGAQTGASSTEPISVQVGMGNQVCGNRDPISRKVLLNRPRSPLNLSISGEGFFQITGPDGKTAYTRDGSFTQDANGQMVTSDGYPLADDITIPNGATDVTISSTGVVTANIPGQTDPKQLGQITLAMFANPGGLTREGNNLYKAGGASGTPVVGNPGSDTGAGSIQSQYLETSNVSVVDEMTRMITAQRAYELNSKAVSTADDMLSVINNLKK